jgi:RND family efflux transporter MFP subunit
MLATVALLTSCNRGGSDADTAEVKPIVSVATVVRRDLAQTLTVQAEFRPYQEVELHAKATGFLQSISVDFGDRVKAGQLLAVIEVPELADDLNRADAASARAAADYKDAHLDYTRMADVARANPNLLAQQDIDAADAKEEMAAANVAAAKAEADKYRTLFSYTRITAPFAGVITQRYVDPGALIQAGTNSGQTGPLVRLSENDRLRLDFPVSVSYAETIRVGDPVEITLEGSGRRISGAVSRFTRRIAVDTRTMETEIEVPNPDLLLIPGMYATVTLDVARRPKALSVPVMAVVTGSHPTVDVVGAGGKVEERTVQLGLETPSDYEILSGLSVGERVIVGSRAGVRPGQEVETKDAQ